MAGDVFWTMFFSWWESGRAGEIFEGLLVRACIGLFGASPKGLGLGAGLA